MAGVTARVLLEVVLVVVLREREGARRRDLGDDRTLPRAALVDLLLHLLGDLLLRVRGVEDRRPVLAPHVVALPVLRCRVVHLEERSLEELAVRDLRRI